MRFSNFQREVEVDASTVRAGLDTLVEQYPSLREVLLDNQHQVRGVHKLFLDGEPLDSLQAAVRHDSEVAVVTAIAGG
ncbi:MAG: MoaD/ThiS family protein [Myxococcales bacterium]|nr:MoaD/ThiS family protein [Myxococcales bacterium]HRC54288.1 MoaD/ThiS family protein [Kofleriaceae bacterium]